MAEDVAVFPREVAGEALGRVVAGAGRQRMAQALRQLDEDRHGAVRRHRPGRPDRNGAEQAGADQRAAGRIDLRLVVNGAFAPADAIDDIGAVELLQPFDPRLAEPRRRPGVDYIRDVHGPGRGIDHGMVLHHLGERMALVLERRRNPPFGREHRPGRGGGTPREAQGWWVEAADIRHGAARSGGQFYSGERVDLARLDRHRHGFRRRLFVDLEMQHGVVIAGRVQHLRQPVEIGLGAAAQRGLALGVLVFERHQLRGVVQRIAEIVRGARELGLVFDPVGQHRP